MKVIRLDDAEAAMLYRYGMERLLIRYQAVLADDFTRPENLLGNTLACLPYLWLLVGDETRDVLAVAGLTDVFPGHSACLHGAAMPAAKRHALDTLTRVVLGCAFGELGLHKLKAVFDADNRGAIGFCRRWRFTREARLRGEVKRGGQMRDVLAYALFSGSESCYTRQVKEKSHVSRP